MSAHLLHKIMDGDMQAYSELYMDYFKKFYNYGKKFTKDTALIEDCIQEVFLDIWSKRNSRVPIDTPGAYLYSSFRYILLRKLKGQQKIVHDEKDVLVFSVENVIINKELDAEVQKKLQAAIKTLTGRQMEAIYLRYYEQLSYPEVAEVLNISTKATYKIMARSLAHLKEQVGVNSYSLLLAIFLIFS